MKINTNRLGLTLAVVFCLTSFLIPTLVSIPAKADASVQSDSPSVSEMNSRTPVRPATKLPKKKSRQTASAYTTQSGATSAAESSSDVVLVPEATSTGQLDQYGLPGHRKSGWSVGLTTSHIVYEEPNFMNEVGTLYGFNVGYDLPVDGHDLVFELGYAAGSMQYNGGRMDHNQEIVVVSDTNDSILNARGTFVGHVPFSPILSGSYFGGLAIRNLHDRINGTGGYGRDIDYVYLPVGVGVAFSPAATWLVSANFEYDVFVSGLVQTHLEDLNAANPTIQNHQSTGEGVRLSGEIRKDLQNIAIKVQPYFQRWHVGDSDHFNIVDERGRHGYMMEPANVSSQVGVNLGVEL